MAGIGRGTAGAVAQRLSVEETLLRVALLARYGSEARRVAQRLAAVCAPGDARSCFEAGAPLQLAIDAPGSAELRVGLRLGGRLDPERLREVVSERALDHLAEFLEPLPADRHASLGAWLYWTPEQPAVFVDLRDPDPRVALGRLERVLGTRRRARLEDVRPALGLARPWGLRVAAGEAGVERVDVYWLLARHSSPASLIEASTPGGWAQVLELLGHLLRRPAVAGRWTVSTSLEDDGSARLRVGNSGWTLVPEDERKHRAVGRLVSALGGPQDYAEALWSLCRGVAAPDWRVGRSCEIELGETELRARLFLTPDVHAGAAAITSNSATSATSAAP